MNNQENKKSWQTIVAIYLIRGFPFFMIFVFWFWILPVLIFNNQITFNVNGISNSIVKQIIQNIPNYGIVNNLLVMSIFELIIMVYIFTFITLASKVVNGRYFKGSTVILQVLLLAAICNITYLIGKIVFVRSQLNNTKYIALNENSMGFLNGRDYAKIINKPKFDGTESQIVCINDSRCYLPKTNKVYMTYTGLNYFFINNGIIQRSEWHIKIESNIVYAKTSNY